MHFHYIRRMKNKLSSQITRRNMALVSFQFLVRMVHSLQFSQFLLFFVSSSCFTCMKKKKKKKRCASFKNLSCFVRLLSPKERYGELGFTPDPLPSPVTASSVPEPRTPELWTWASDPDPVWPE